MWRKKLTLWHHFATLVQHVEGVSAFEISYFRDKSRSWSSLSLRR
jgi:hypothetical protein